MRIRWTPAAAADLEQIKKYLTERMPDFAHSTGFRIYRTVQSLRIVGASDENMAHANWSSRHFRTSSRTEFAKTQ